MRCEKSPLTVIHYSWKKNNVTITSLGYIAKAYLFFDEGLDHMTDDQRELLTEYNQHIPGLLRDVRNPKIVVRTCLNYVVSDPSR